MILLAVHNPFMELFVFCLIMGCILGFWWVVDGLRNWWLQ